MRLILATLFVGTFSMLAACGGGGSAPTDHNPVPAPPTNTQPLAWDAGSWDEDTWQ
jgi:hypothetical protein